MNTRAFWIIFFFFYSLPPVYSQVVSNPTAEETELSSRIKEDITKLLDQLVGAGKSKVFVSVQGETVLKTRTESGPPGENIVTLPGYSSVNILERTNEYIRQQKSEAEHTAEFKIKKIHASIILDRSIPDTKANTIKLLVSDVLRLDEKRGDSLILAKAEMLPWWKNLVEAPGTHKTMLIAAILAAGLSLVAIFVYILASKLLKSFVDYAKSQTPFASGQPYQPMPGRQEGPVSGGTAQGEETGEVIDIESAPGGGKLLEAQTPFDFIDKYTPENLAELLHGEPPEDAALVIANITDKKPHISSRLLLSLPIKERQEITKHIISLKEVDPERLMEVEMRLREKIERTLRGTEKLGKLLSIVDADERDEIINNLTGVDPESLQKVKSSLLSFEDICRMETENLRPLVIAMPYQEWASALQGTQEESIANVEKLFPEDIRNILKEMMAVSQTKEKIIMARLGIISAAMDLNAKGKIKLPSNTAS
ncbi:MAG: hypothetical protein HY746_09505 [Elusimicrobia bacterium]|nr:hypothetical protein [Elusimicrobiota bacterium]